MKMKPETLKRRAAQRASERAHRRADLLRRLRQAAARAIRDGKDDIYTEQIVEIEVHTPGTAAHHVSTTGTNVKARLEGIVTLRQAGHTVKVSKYDPTQLIIGGRRFGWEVLENPHLIGTWKRFAPREAHGRKVEITLTCQGTPCKVMAVPVRHDFAIHHPVDWQGNPMKGYTVTHVHSGKQADAGGFFRTIKAAREWAEFLSDLPMDWSTASPAAPPALVKKILSRRTAMEMEGITFRSK